METGGRYRQSPDYIAPDTVANFERETGIKVRYDTYESDEVLETKLLTGHTNYDIVGPSAGAASLYRLIEINVYQNRAVEDKPLRSCCGCSAN